MTKKKNKSAEAPEKKINRIYTQALTCEKEKFYINLKNMAKEVLISNDQEGFRLFLHLADNYKGRLTGEQLAEMAEIIIQSGGIAQMAAMRAGIDTSKKLIEVADQMAGGAVMRNPALNEKSAEIKTMCAEMLKNVDKLNMYSYFNEINKMVDTQLKGTVHNAQKRHK